MNSQIRRKVLWTWHTISLLAPLEKTSTEMAPTVFRSHLRAYEFKFMVEFLFWPGLRRGSLGSILDSSEKISSEGTFMVLAESLSASIDKMNHTDGIIIWRIYLRRKL